MNQSIERLLVLYTGGTIGMEMSESGLAPASGFEDRLKAEQRVALLRSDKVDPDMLDERARYQLDYADPRDLVRMLHAK